MNERPHFLYTCPHFGNKAEVIAYIGPIIRRGWTCDACIPTALQKMLGFIEPGISFVVRFMREGATLSLNGKWEGSGNLPINRIITIIDAFDGVTHD